MEQTITCADCGHEHTAKRKNARYCGICRLFRNLIYLGARTSRCASCDGKFSPLHVNDKLCANCDFSQGKDGRGNCALCEQKDMPLVKAEVAVCVYCAKDPTRRDVFTRAIGKKRKARMDKAVPA